MSSLVSKVSAALAAVCLLLAGLMSVAAPTQAREGDSEVRTYYKGCGYTAPGSAEELVPPTREEAQAVCDAKFGPGMIIWNGYYGKRSNSPGNADWYIGGNPTEQYCASEGKVQTDDGTSCRSKTNEEKCEESGKYWYDNSCNEKSPSEKKCLEEGDKWEDGECLPWREVMPIVDVIDLDVCEDGFVNNEAGKCIPVSAIECEDGFIRGGDGKCAPVSAIECEDGFVRNGDAYCVPVRAGDSAVGDAGDLSDDSQGGGTTGLEPVQENPPPPPCWSELALNNCPVGGALRFAAPEYAMVGVPVTMYAYASWRPDENSPAQPTNGTAVIRVDGEDYSGVEFKDGVASWRFIPEIEGMKEFTASGVVFSNTSGASAYIDTVPARTYVLEYDPAAYATALKNKLVEIGSKYVITDPNQARSYLEDRYEWRVSGKSEDVCAVYETKRGTVKAKFNSEGKCKVIWMDTSSGDKGNFTFIAEK